MSFIFNVVINVAILLMFLRFMLQLARVNPYNPVVMSTFKGTQIVDVFNRILPNLGRGRINLAALVLLILLYLLKVYGMVNLEPNITVFSNHYYSSQILSGALPFIMTTFMYMLDSLLLFLKFLVFGVVILSWVVMFTQSNSPYIEVVQALAEPLIAPFRRVIPQVGPLDLSVIVVILVLMVVTMLMEAASMNLLASVM